MALRALFDMPVRKEVKLLNWIHICQTVLVILAFVLGIAKLANTDRARRTRSDTWIIGVVGLVTRSWSIFNGS
jgi:hypothetical protein